jgi:hypothetical protein
MRYNEQKLTNKSRIYYHGTINRDEASAIPNFPWFSITTNFMYAVCYARKCQIEFGIIKKFVINRELNVFNARCITDSEKLRKTLNVDDSKWSKIETILRDKDWVLLGEKLRQKIIQVLMSLGYDGFFNFECTERCPYLMDFGIRGNYENSASFGIFNKDCLTEIEVLEREDFEKESNLFKKQHKDEIEYQITHIPLLLKEGLSKDEILLQIYDLCPTLTWAELEENYPKIKESYEMKSFFKEVYRESVRKQYERFRKIN